MREMMQQAFVYAKKPLLQHPRLHQSLRYLYESVLGRAQKADGYVIKGLTKGSDYKMTMLYVGTKNSAHQLASLVFAQISGFLPLGDILLHEAGVLSATKLPDIVVLDVQRPFVHKFSKRGYLLLPNVNFILDMRFSIDNIIERMSRRRRRDIRKIRTLNYSYAVCRDSEKDFNFFYHKMYLPYAQSRFGKAAYVKPYLESKTVFKSNGGVIFAKRSNKPLAGILFNIQSSKLHAWGFGAHEGNQRLVEELAGEATLLFLIEWAKTQGIESLDYGVSLPFLRDGIFMYKKEWGMSVNEQRDNSVWALKVDLANERSLTFLEQNPFIVTDKDELKAVVFVDHKVTRVELEQIHSRYYLPNLRSLIVVSYSKPSPETMSLVGPRAGKLADNLMIPLQDICQKLQQKDFLVEVFEF